MTSQKTIPSARSAVDPFLAMDVLSAARALEAEGRHLIHMEVGQPGAPAPSTVLAAARQALEGGRLGYTEARGIAPLRQRIARHYRDAYGVEVPESRIMVTTGSSAGFNLSFLAAFDPGDRIVLTAPGYPAYRNIIKALGLVPVEIEVGPDTRWSLTPDHIAAALKDGPVKGVLVASPANPTGTMMTPAALAGLARFCDDAGIWFISDEIYHGLVYDGQQACALETSQNAIIINSFSKYYCMTGWRIGWMVLPEDLIRPVERLAQNLFISPPHIAQVAAEAAFGCTAELEENRARYRRNRDLLLRELPRAGLPAPAAADGAFYLWFDIGGLLAQGVAQDSLAFCSALLERAGIAATPGVDFDPARGGRFLRLSYCGPEEAIAAAPARFAAFLRRG